MSFFKKLKESIASKTEAVTNVFKEGLSKTRTAFVEKVEELITRRKKIDEEFNEEIEEILTGTAVGGNTVMTLIDELRTEVKKRKIEDASDLQPGLSEKLIELLKGDDHAELRMAPERQITVVLFVGV